MLITLQLLKTTSEIFIENLRMQRKARGWSQTNMAEAVGMSLRGFQKYEQGETQPTLDIVEQFAGKLGCDPLELLASSSGDERHSYVKDGDRGGGKGRREDESHKRRNVSAKQEMPGGRDDYENEKGHDLASEIADQVITRLGSRDLSLEVWAFLRRFDGASAERQAAAMYCLTLDPHYLEELVQLTKDRGRAAKDAVAALKTLLSPAKK